MVDAGRTSALNIVVMYWWLFVLKTFRGVLLFCERKSGKKRRRVHSEAGYDQSSALLKRQNVHQFSCSDHVQFPLVPFEQATCAVLTLFVPTKKIKVNKATRFLLNLSSRARPKKIRWRDSDKKRSRACMYMFNQDENDSDWDWE